MFLNITFNLVKSLIPYVRVIPVDYRIRVESNFEIKWTFGNNYACVDTKSSNPISADTFSYNWNNSVVWPASDYEANYLKNPDSSYKGYTTKILF